MDDVRGPTRADCALSWSFEGILLPFDDFCDALRGSIRGPVCFDYLNIGRASRHGEVRRNPYTRIMTSPPASATVFSAAPAQAIQVSALGASENLLSAVEYCLQVLELLTTTVTGLPYRGFLRLEWFRLDWVLCRPCHAKHR